MTPDQIREAFEAWRKAWDKDRRVPGEPDAWAGWQASREVALTEVAKHKPQCWGNAKGFWLGCSCGWNENGEFMGVQYKFDQHLCEALKRAPAAPASSVISAAAS